MVEVLLNLYSKIWYSYWEWCFYRISDDLEKLCVLDEKKAERKIELWTI